MGIDACIYVKMCDGVTEPRLEQPLLVPMMIPAPTWVLRQPWEPPYIVTYGTAQ
jgi:hypothetical protein